MPTMRKSLGLALLLFGAALLVAVLYDATEVTRLAGLSPEGGEAGVALAGLGLAATALALGARLFRRGIAPAAAG